MGSNHMRARMPSAQPKAKQLCCASSSKVAPDRAALPDDGAHRGVLSLVGQGQALGNGMKLSASSCCGETWRNFPGGSRPVQVLAADVSSNPAHPLSQAEERKQKASLEHQHEEPVIRQGTGRLNSKQLQRDIP